MRCHTLVGGSILGGGHTELMETAESIARSHHERWDGSGYPDGLAGERIPLAARIVAIADVFDAVTTPRHYREAWSRERAEEEIRRGTGTHFDPGLVEAFLVLQQERFPPAGLQTSEVDRLKEPGSGNMAEASE
jgi:putative two-component system response regulator